MDLECEDKEVGLDELRWIHRHKTGALLKVRLRYDIVQVLFFHDTYDMISQNTTQIKSYTTTISVL